jgi:tetratricopeptide (TPR) repeat protein
MAVVLEMHKHSFEACCAALCFALCTAFHCRLAHAQDHTPGDIPSLAARAESLEQQGKLDDAAATYREILRLDPRSVPALNRLGALAVERQDFTGGIGYYRRALAVNPREFATNLNLGIAYIKVSDYGSARPPLQIATEDEPEDFRARELLGVAMIGQENYSGAIPQLEAASRLRPQDVGTMYLLDRAYLESAQYPKALTAFKQIEALDPGSPWLHVLQGQAHPPLRGPPSPKGRGVGGEGRLSTAGLKSRPSASKFVLPG